MATPPSGVDRWLLINGRPLSFAEGTENEALNLLEYTVHTIEITAAAPRHLALWIDGEELQTARYGIWTWRPIDYAGLYRCEVEVQAFGEGEAGPRLTTWVRVFPRHLTQFLYEKMQDELSQIALDLLYRLDSPANERTKYTPRVQETSALHDYKQISLLITELRDVMTQLRRDPHHALRSRCIERDWLDMRRSPVEATSVPDGVLALPASLARRTGMRYLPRTWNTQERDLTYDTYENRLLKHFLRQQLIARLALIERRALNEEQRLQKVYARYHNAEDGRALARLRAAGADCRQMRQRCLRWSSETFLRTVQSSVQTARATQVLLKHPTYSRFYHLYLHFQQRLKITRDVETSVGELALRRVSDLYEMWSVFTLTRLAVEELLAAGYRMVSNSTFYEVEKDYFQFQVRKNTPSIVLARGDTRVEFKYEPIYPNQVNVHEHSAVVTTIYGTNPQTPDLAIESYRAGVPQDILLFDAKYRRERTADGVYHPKDEDIGKANNYKHRIQYQRYNPGRAKNPYELTSIVRGVYLLFPGDLIHIEPGTDAAIGAYPLKPGLSERHLTEIRVHLNLLLHRARML